MSCSIVTTLVKVNRRNKKETNGIHRSGLSLITSEDIDNLIGKILTDYNLSKTPVDYIDIKTTITIDSNVMGSSITLKAYVKDFKSLREELVRMALRCNEVITEKSKDETGISLFDIKEIAQLHYEFIKRTGEAESALNPEVFRRFLCWAKEQRGEAIRAEAYLDCCNRYKSLHGSLSKGFTLTESKYIELMGKIFIETRLRNR